MRTLPVIATLLATAASATLARAGELIPFVLPWDDDSPGITDLSHYNHAPAGKFGYISVDENAHFSVGDERVRFLGVNVTDRSCFPTHEEAEAIAGRLAKFGINIVRFHHMDNNWSAASIIDYSQGNSRSLHVGNLELLDYFIAQLKSRGIYVNLNLVNSRDLRTGDGLDPAAQATLSWKERHMLTLVDPTAREREKEFATKLLSHVNQHTGLSYADDPAIAVVEVNNENGVFQQYFDGVLDRWPDVYKSQLQTKWNAWIAQKYPDTASMLAAWSGVSEPLGPELIVNGDFANGQASWNVEQHGDAQVASNVGSHFGRPAINYWVDMRDHIKTELGYGGLVNGTTIMNSPPNIQAVYDFADAHSYWQHPRFPGEEWDPNNWYVNPVSMANSLNSTIAGLARQRLDGFPHTVSEYRHAYPNPFASEGPLMIAAYAALQDWDGIYFFDYAEGESWDQGYFNGYFNMNAHPSAMANTLVAANLFRRGGPKPIRLRRKLGATSPPTLTATPQTLACSAA